jgi:hypothetical protein
MSAAVIKYTKPTKEVVVVTRASAKKKVKTSRRRRRRNRSSTITHSSSRGALDEWVKLLNCPFESLPIRIGFGCMVPSTLATAYVKGTVLANATDGSFAIAFCPTLGYGSQFAGTWNSGATTTTNTSIAWSNQGSIYTCMSEARVVAMSLRVQPLLAATAAPGMLYAGSLASCNSSTLAGTFQPTLLANLPGTKNNIGWGGATVTSRPTDVSGFEFLVQNVTPNTGVYFNWSTLYVAGLGFPANTSIFYECVLHLEGIAGTADTIQNAVLGEQAGDEVKPTTLENLFSSATAAYKNLSPYLNHHTVMSAAQDYAITGDPLSAMQAGFHAMNSHRHNRAQIDRPFENLRIEEV